MKVVFLIPASVHLLDLAGPAQVFYEAREYGAPIELHYTGFDFGHIKSSAGLNFQQLPLYSAFSLTAGDIVIIPGLDFNSEDVGRSATIGDLAKVATQLIAAKQTEGFLPWLRQQSCPYSFLNILYFCLSENQTEYFK